MHAMAKFRTSKSLKRKSGDIAIPEANDGAFKNYFRGRNYSC